MQAWKELLVSEKGKKKLSGEVSAGQVSSALSPIKMLFWIMSVCALTTTVIAQLQTAMLEMPHSPLGIPFYGTYQNVE
jgi:hypothetical protein